MTTNAIGWSITSPHFQIALNNRECSTYETITIIPQTKNDCEHDFQLHNAPQRHQRECHHPYDVPRTHPLSAIARTPKSFDTMQDYF